MSYGARHLNLNSESATYVILGKSIHWTHLNLTILPVLQGR